MPTRTLWTRSKSPYNNSHVTSPISGTVYIPFRFPSTTSFQPGPSFLHVCGSQPTANTRQVFWSRTSANLVARTSCSGYLGMEIHRAHGTDILLPSLSPSLARELWGRGECIIFTGYDAGKDLPTNSTVTATVLVTKHFPRADDSSRGFVQQELTHPTSFTRSSMGS